MNPEAPVPALPANAMASAGHEALPPKVQGALLGLANSRLALRAVLVPPPALAPPQPASPGAWARLWWRRLRHWPAGRVAGELAQQWWHRHPWRPLGDTLIGETRGVVWPLVRRHPWLSVGAAAAAGACLVAAKPWRWGWVDRQVRRAPSALSTFVLAQLSSAPVQAGLAALLALMVRQHASGTADAAPGPAKPVAPPASDPPGGEPPMPGTGPTPAPVREPADRPAHPVREPQPAVG